MHKISRLGSKGRLGKCWHLDATSPYAKRDYEQNANGYRHIYAFLDPVRSEVQKGAFRLIRGKHWAGGFGPIHVVSGADGVKMQMKDFVAFCRRGAFDRFGRVRKCVAYRGIIAPPDLLQMAMRDMCLRAPKHADRFFQDAFSWLKTRLHKLFPGVPIQSAFHTLPGRAHWEWICPKYAPSGRPARAGVDWDGHTYSARHAVALVRTGQMAKGYPTNLNSTVEAEFSRYLIRTYRDVMKKAGVSPHTRTDIYQAELFFLQL
jgi:hypothetical protein